MLIASVGILDKRVTVIRYLGFFFFDDSSIRFLCNWNNDSEEEKRLEISISEIYLINQKKVCCFWMDRYIHFLSLKGNQLSGFFLL